MVDLGNVPDLEMIAKAYGIPFFRIKNNNEIEDYINRFLKSTKGALMECMLDPMDVVK